MGINPTLPNFKTLTFDGSNSAAYGVYLTGEAVFNAPERAVEMVSIPGRNGAFALDKGHFENIEVKYKAGIFADTQADFADAISNFRNMLCSKVGYCRLTDDYNPNEYRMAVYKRGLEVTHEGLLTGEFDIVFDCKPQRYLTSGETKSTVASGGTVTNPTLFDSHPLLEVEGYGTIQFNDYDIELDNAVMGDVSIDASYGTFSNALYNDGDTITVGFTRHTFTLFTSGREKFTAANGSADDASYVVLSSRLQNNKCQVIFHGPEVEFTAGTAETKTLATFTVTGTAIKSGVTKSHEIQWAVSATYTPGADKDTITFSSTRTIVTAGYVTSSSRSSLASDISAYSTISILGHPTYIDCEIGEAYIQSGDEYISLNRYIDLGSDLPKFVPGSNEITFDNTVTQLDVTPRWWKI